MQEANAIPVFIVGAQRSGTTMLRLMLNAHARFAVPFESDFLRPLVAGNAPREFASSEDIRRAVDALADEKFTMKAAVIADRNEIAASQLRSYADLVIRVFADFARSKGKARWGIKTPGYTTNIDLLHDLFPQARIIHIVRDGRDVLLSRRKIKWGGKNTLKIAQDWRWQVLMGRKLGMMTRGQYMEIRYEDLVQDAPVVLKRICNFLGEEFDANMLSYHEHGKDEMPADSLAWHGSSVSAPDASKIYAWKTQLPRTEQQLFQEIARDALVAFEYEIVPYDGRRIVPRLKRAYYAMKM